MFFVYNPAEKITMSLATNFLSQVYQFGENGAKFFSKVLSFPQRIVVLLKFCALTLLFFVPPLLCLAMKKISNEVIFCPY